MNTSTALDMSCKHCGTGFTSRAIEASGEFCCRGCESVYELLQVEGLGSYYDIRQMAPPVCPLPVRVSSESYDYCDDASFIGRASRDGETMEFFLEGLDCTACLWLLEKLPSLCPDATFARVNMASSTIAVKRKSGGSFAAIARTLSRLGHRPQALELGTDAATPANLQRAENRRSLIRIGIAGGATGNIMILAVSLYGGATGLLAEQFRTLSALLAAPVLTYCAWPFYRSALGALRNRHLNLDVPIVAAILAGILFSLIGLASGRDVVYFDSLSMLVFLLLSSRHWLKRIQQSHLSATRLQDYLLLATVKVTANGQEQNVSSMSLKKGDLVVIDGEGQIPADGVVSEGRGVIQTAVLTGESTPIAVEAGDLVEAGSRALSGRFVLDVKKTPSQSRIAEILQAAETAAATKPALVHFADKVSQAFIAVVFLSAFLVVAAFAASDLPEGLSRALALVIVTCPCVFGMAIPLSMSLAIRAAAKKGIVIKDADVIERVTQLEKLVFDKTGTLTKGEITVTKMEAGIELQYDLAAALAIEVDQPHPVARALTRSLQRLGLPRLEAKNVHPLTVGGVAGQVGGIRYAVSPLGRGGQEGAKISADYGIFREGRLVTEFSVGDELRDEATGLIRWARENDIETTLLSGDRPEIVRSCGETLGIPSDRVIAAATPESKADFLKHKGARAAMVGDGVNDAAALASASVGIAVRGSMDVSLRAADVYLTRSTLSSIPLLFAIAKSTRVAILRNLAFSAGFNLVAGALAVFGHMTPLWAAVLMPLSSLTVLASALATGRSLDAMNLENAPEEKA